MRPMTCAFAFCFLDFSFTLHRTPKCTMLSRIKKSCKEHSKKVFSTHSVPHMTNCIQLTWLNLAAFYFLRKASQFRHPVHFYNGVTEAP